MKKVLILIASFGTACAAYAVYAQQTKITVEESSVQLQVDTVIGGYYDIQQSSNLVDWNSVGTLNADETPEFVTIPRNPATKMEYFRVATLPTPPFFSDTFVSLGIYTHYDSRDHVPTVMNNDGALYWVNDAFQLVKLESSGTRTTTALTGPGLALLQAEDDWKLLRPQDPTVDRLVFYDDWSSSPYYNKIVTVDDSGQTLVMDVNTLLSTVPSESGVTWKVTLRNARVFEDGILLSLEKEASFPTKGEYSYAVLGYDGLLSGFGSIPVLDIAGNLFDPFSKPIYDAGKVLRAGRRFTPIGPHSTSESAAVIMAVNLADQSIEEWEILDNVNDPEWVSGFFKHAGNYMVLGSQTTVNSTISKNSERFVANVAPSGAVNWISYFGYESGSPYLNTSSEAYSFAGSFIHRASPSSLFVQIRDASTYSVEARSIPSTGRIIVSGSEKFFVNSETREITTF